MIAVLCANFALVSASQTEFWWKLNYQFETKTSKTKCEAKRHKLMLAMQQSRHNGRNRAWLAQLFWIENKLCKELNYRSCEKYNSAGLLLILSKSNTILTESKQEVKKKHWFAKSQKRAQLNPAKQQDSAKHLLTSSKSLLQMNETDIYYKQIWETKSNIKKLHSVVVCSKFLVKALHMNHGGFQCQI